MNFLALRSPLISTRLHSGRPGSARDLHWPGTLSFPRNTQSQMLGYLRMPWLYPHVFLLWPSHRWAGRVYPIRGSGRDSAMYQEELRALTLILNKAID